MSQCLIEAHSQCFVMVRRSKSFYRVKSLLRTSPQCHGSFFCIQILDALFCIWGMWFINIVDDFRLRELLLKGVGYHHAGLDSHDRHLTEELFTQGELLVLGQY